MIKKALICSLLLCWSAFALEENLSADAVNASNLRQWLAADYGVSIDDEGDIYCKNGDRGFYVLFRDDIKLLNFRSTWSKPEKLSIAELVVLANEFNNDKIFIRVCVNNSGSVVLEYFMPYDGGLNQKNFKAALHWFTAVEDGWIDCLSEEMDKVCEVPTVGKIPVVEKIPVVSKPISTGVLRDMPIKCRTNGLAGMPNFGGYGRSVYIKNNSDETLHIHVEQDGAYGAFGVTLSDATGDYTIMPHSEISFLSEVARTLTITADGYKPVEYVVDIM